MTILIDHIINQLEIFNVHTVFQFQIALKNDDITSLRDLQRYIINHSDRSDNNHSNLVRNIDDLIYQLYGC